MAHKLRPYSTLAPHEYGGVWSGLPNQSLPEDHGTSHVSVLDGAGNAVAITTTVNRAFGSFVVSPSTGILLNDQMDDFSDFLMPTDPIPYVCLCIGAPFAPSQARRVHALPA